MKYLALSVFVFLAGCAPRHFAVCITSGENIGCSAPTLTKKEAMKFGRILSAATGENVGIASKTGGHEGPPPPLPHEPADKI